MTVKKEVKLRIFKKQGPSVDGTLQHKIIFRQAFGSKLSEQARNLKLILYGVPASSKDEVPELKFLVCRGKY